MIATAIAVLVFIAAFVQTVYCLYFFMRIFGLKAADTAAVTKAHPLLPCAGLPISVIICARNEAVNLTECLPTILEQQYHDEAGNPCFEVLVVNDQSTDDTATVLAGFEGQYPWLNVITIAPDEQRALPGKKFALSKAIASAQHDHLLMTDADCKAASVHWITCMAAPFRKGREIAGGYGGFHTRIGWLNLFIRCETIHTYLQYLTYNLAGVPYMAVGRNLACKKELLVKAQAHELWGRTASGDDDLLIRLGATAHNMTINTSPLSFTWSEAKSTADSWIKQKQRHFSTGKLYRRRVQLLLGLYAFSHAVFWCGLIAMLFCPPAGPMLKGVGGMVLFRCGIFWLAGFRLSSKVNDRQVRWYWPLFDFAWLPYNFIFAPYIFWKNKRQWT